MQYNPKFDTVEEGLGLAPERSKELQDLMNDAFEVLGTNENFTTADLLALLTPRLETAADAFYVAWIARGVIATYTTA